MDINSWTFSRLGESSYDTDKAVFIDASEPSRSLTAGEVRHYVRRLIAGLKAIGLRKGDTVCILTFSHIYYTPLYLAVIGAGGQVAGGNPGHTTFELLHLLETSNSKFMVTEPAIYQKALAAATQANIPPTDIYCYHPLDEDSGPSAYNSWSRLLEYGESDWETLNEEEAARTPAVLYSTSGTTGLPKLASIPHSYLVSNGKFVEQCSANKHYQISRLVSLPLVHAFAAPIVHASAIREGIPTYILPRFSIPAFVHAIETYQITDVPAVPSMLYSALAAPEFHPSRLTSIREVLSAGAPLSATLQQQVAEQLPQHARVIQLYGATEAGWISSIAYPDTDNTGSIGAPVHPVKFRLVDEQGQDIQPVDGAMGELRASVPHPTLGYKNNPEASAEIFDDQGYVITGDIAYTQGGKYYLIDREKDMIKVRGWRVAPAELESVLLQHPSVAEAAVIGLPDEASGELPHAFIVCKARAADTESELRAFIKERLAAYKQIASFSFVEAIPKNPAGKVLKRLLKGDALLRMQGREARESERRPVTEKSVDRFDARENRNTPVMVI